MQVGVTIDQSVSSFANNNEVESRVSESLGKPSVSVVDNASSVDTNKPIDTNVNEKEEEETNLNSVKGESHVSLSSVPVNSDASNIENQEEIHSLDVPDCSKQEDSNNEGVRVDSEKDESRAIYGWHYSFPLPSEEEVKKSLEKYSNFLYIPSDPEAPSGSSDALISQLPRKASKGVMRRVKRLSSGVETTSILTIAVMIVDSNDSVPTNQTELENEVFDYQQQSDMLSQGLFSLRTDLDGLRKRVKTEFYRPEPRSIDQSVNVWEGQNEPLKCDCIEEKTRKEVDSKEEENQEVDLKEEENQEMDKKEVDLKEVKDLNVEDQKGMDSIEVEDQKEVNQKELSQKEVEDQIEVDSKEVNQMEVEKKEMEKQKEEKDNEKVEAQSVERVPMNVPERAPIKTSSIPSQILSLRQSPGLSAILPSLRLSASPSSPVQLLVSPNEVPIPTSETAIDSKSDREPSVSSSRRSSISSAPATKQKTPLDIDCSYEIEEDLQTVLERIQPYIGPEYKSSQLPLIPEPILVFPKVQEPRQNENKEELLDSLYSTLVNGTLSNTSLETKPPPIVPEPNPLFNDYKVCHLPPLYNASLYLVSYKHTLQYTLQRAEAFQPNSSLSSIILLLILHKATHRWSTNHTRTRSKTCSSHWGIIFAIGVHQCRVATASSHIVASELTTTIGSEGRSTEITRSGRSGCTQTSRHGGSHR